jgi:hypothetical protein
VVVLPDRPDALVAYVVPRDGAALDPRELREHLAARLPGYMLPAATVLLDRLPLTANDKLDRSALPAPGADDTAAGRAPATPQEELVCAAFAAVLGVPAVGVHDNFFERGGHSLSGVRLVSRIRSLLGVELPLRVLFEAPTPAELSRRLHTAATARPPVTALAATAGHGDGEAVPLSYSQQRLWFLSKLDEESIAYHMPFAFRLTGRLDPNALRAALQDVVARHDVLRTVYPERDGQARQQVLDIADALPGLPFIDATEADVPGMIRDAVAAPFDLAARPPLRCRVLVLGQEEHVLVVVVHHIAADGWSLGPLARDLGAAYTARSEGRAPGWAPLPVQYADYARWQRDELAAAGQLEFWVAELAGLPEEITLPADRRRAGGRRRDHVRHGAARRAHRRAACADRQQDPGRRGGHR